MTYSLVWINAFEDFLVLKANTNTGSDGIPFIHGHDSYIWYVQWATSPAWWHLFPTRQRGLTWLRVHIMTKVWSCHNAFNTNPITTKFLFLNVVCLVLIHHYKLWHNRKLFILHVLHCRCYWYHTGIENPDKDIDEILGEVGDSNTVGEKENSEKQREGEEGGDNDGEAGEETQQNTTVTEVKITLITNSKNICLSARFALNSTIHKGWGIPMTMFFIGHPTLVQKIQRRLLLRQISHRVNMSCTQPDGHNLLFSILKHVWNSTWNALT